MKWRWFMRVDDTAHYLLIQSCVFFLSFFFNKKHYCSSSLAIVKKPIEGPLHPLRFFHVCSKSWDVCHSTTPSHSGYHQQGSIQGIPFYKPLLKKWRCKYLCHISWSVWSKLQSGNKQSKQNRTKEKNKVTYIFGSCHHT